MSDPFTIFCEDHLYMTKKDRAEETLENFRKVNTEIDYLIDKVNLNIESTNKEIDDRINKRTGNKIER